MSRVSQLGTVRFRHYNAEMHLKIAAWCFGKSALMATIVLSSCLFLAQSSTAQQPRLAALPANPAATPNPPPHAFWDRTNILLFSGIAVTRAMDYASTRNFQARGRQEILIPDDVVNNSAGFAGLEAAATMTSVGISYLLHHYGHHKLERWLSIGHIGVTAFGDVRNYSIESRHR